MEDNKIKIIVYSGVIILMLIPHPSKFTDVVRWVTCLMSAPRGLQMFKHYDVDDADDDADGRLDNGIYYEPIIGDSDIFDGGDRTCTSTWGGWWYPVNVEISRDISYHN